MPPRKHVAKSQEHIYVKVGKGSRTKYRMMATDIMPQSSGISTSASGSEPIPPPVPPIISPPSGNETTDFTDIPFESEGYESRPKRTGKVGFDW
jgi:hypothetical protein